MKKITTLILLVLPIVQFAFAQKIGDSAEEVKLGAKLEVENYYKARGYHQVRMAYDVRYFNGKISDVILCKENVPILDLGKAVDFCTHYIMEKGYLTNILTQYSNISIRELEEALSRDYKKVDNYYFDSNDTDNYYKTYLSKSGQATKVCLSKVINPIPANVIEKLNKLNAESSNYGISGRSISLTKFSNLKLPIDDGGQSGRIVVEVKINKEGVVTEAFPGVIGTTIKDEELWKKCNDAIMKSTFNQSTSVPYILSGRVIFNFKVR